MTRNWMLAALAAATLGCSASAGEGPSVGGGAAPGGGSGPDAPQRPGDKGDDGGPVTPPSGPTTPPSGQDDVCEEQVVRANPVIPDMLIVLDRSGSMQQEGRWEPSRSAVKSITAALEDKIRFGLMMFPKVCGFFDLGCSLGSGGCPPGEIDVPIAISAADEIAAVVDDARSDGSTPTGASLENAAGELAQMRMSVPPDSAVPPQYVLLVTDGEPSCGNNSKDTEVARANRAIEDLTAQGVTTYVIGYDTQNDPELAGVLDGFAQRGGTGTHRPVEDEASLVTEFEQIAGEIVSCTFQLEKEPSDPSYVKVTLDGTQRNHGDPDGWSIDGATITLEGSACATLQDGGEHTLGVEVLCVPVAPI